MYVKYQSEDNIICKPATMSVFDIIYQKVFLHQPNLYRRIFFFKFKIQFGLFTFRPPVTVLWQAVS